MFLLYKDILLVCSEEQALWILLLSQSIMLSSIFLSVVYHFPIHQTDI